MVNKVVFVLVLVSVCVVPVLFVLVEDFVVLVKIEFVLLLEFVDVDVFVWPV